MVLLLAYLASGPVGMWYESGFSFIGASSTSSVMVVSISSTLVSVSFVVVALYILVPPDCVLFLAS